MQNVEDFWFPMVSDGQGIESSHILAVLLQDRAEDGRGNAEL